MAKMKVHELAKELGRQSKELIALLQDKGYEVKAAQSSIEEEAISLVKKHFGGKKEEAGTDDAGKRAHTETSGKAASAAALKAAAEDNAVSATEEKPVLNAQQKAADPEQKTARPAETGAEKAAEKTEALAQHKTASEKAAPETATPKAAPEAAPEAAPKAAPEAAPEAAPKAAPEAAPEVRKKKKKIIFVSNPHNSKMAGGRPQQGGDRRPAGNRNNNGIRQGTPVRQSKEAPYRPIRPLTPPSPTPPVTMVTSSPNVKRDGKPSPNTESRQTPERTAAAPAPAARTEAVNTPAQRSGQTGGQTVSARPQDRQGYAGGSNSRYPNNNAGRPNNNSGYQNSNPRSADGQRRTDNRNENRTGSENRYAARPAGQNRPAYAGGQSRPGYAGAQNRPAYAGGQGDRRGPSGAPNNNRPYNGNERGGRGNAGPDNRFRKPAPGRGFTPESPVKDTEKRRDDEKRRIGQEKDKRSKKDLIYEEEEAKTAAKKAGRFIRPEKREEAQEEQIKVIIVPETLTIKELADKMRLQPSVIIKKLFLQGQIVTVNSEITYEDAENIAIDYDIICEREVKVDVIEELLKEENDREEDMTPRPPVICVMGHVDHGKTSLLDAIRKTNVTDKEAGGITQHIGAYTVNVNNQKITFLDTPGHEAFTAMRMRGANATDIAILVVAADDGVMPQTVEAINHAKAAGIEIIVAVNKMDKPNANIDRVKQEMTEYELIPVDWGGTTEFVPVSAKSGEGIDTLLETILLTAEILELKANAKRQARGLVIEAELDKGRGPVATVLVQKGTLHVGDFISAGASHGKVRAMIDDKGRRVKEALPSTPVEILGLSDVPSAGEVFLAHENDKTAKNYAETYLAQNKVKMLEDTKARMSLDDLFTQIQAGNLKELNLIVKADVQGSVEAVKQSLLKLSNEEVVVKCIHGGVGAINESDVSLASASQAIIIGFNVRPDAQAKTIAEREGVDIRLYRVIYQAIEDVEAAMKGMLDPIFEEKVIGHAEVRQIFKASAVGNIAGSYVLDGEFRRDCKVRITREGEQIYEGELASLKRFKDDVKEVKAGFECGFVFAGFDQMQELDIVEAYIMVEVPR